MCSHCIPKRGRHSMERIFHIDTANLNEFMAEPSEMAEDQFNALACAYMDQISLNFHPKRHVFFFKMHERIPLTRLDLCDVFIWCRHSHLIQRVGTVDIQSSMQVAFMGTVFSNMLLVAQPLCSEQDKQRGCKVSIAYDRNLKTIQIIARRGKNVKGDLFVGVSIATPNTCMQCKCGPTEATLKACKNCFAKDRIRVLYCSKDCQRADYSRHKHVCQNEWSDDDWREWRVVTRPRKANRPGVEASENCAIDVE